jgi:hypothetical protein
MRGGTVSKQKIFRSIIGAIVLSLTCSPVFSADVTIGWTSPTTNADGSQMEPGDLAGFEIYYGQESRFTDEGIEKPNFVYEHSVNAGMVNTHRITGLSSGTTYFFAVKAYDSGWQFSNFCENPFEISMTTDAEDTTPPEILDIIIGEITQWTCEIWWITDELSDSQARYGETSDYGFWTERDPEMVTLHYVKLFSLDPDTLYHFQVGSRDAAGNLGYSDDMTFRTRQKLYNVPPPEDE